MSLLPKRKKSVEEITQLRENFGIPLEPDPSPAEIEKIIPNTHEAVLEPSAPTIPAAEKPSKAPKQVRSLRKSEQGPLPTSSVSVEARVPYQRHSEGEIKEFHRREALALLNATAAANIRRPAHPALLIPGYLATLIAAIGFHYYEFQMMVTASCLVVSLFIAIWVFIRNPYSRHHAAFISIAVLFTAVFAALRYFPQLNLQNGS